MFTALTLALMLLQAPSGPASPPAVKSPWTVHIVSAEWIKPGTQGEPRAGPGKVILKVVVKFEYKASEGMVPAPVLKVTDGDSKEYIMLGNLVAAVPTSGSLSCLTWLMSASEVVLHKKPKPLDSKAIAECPEAVSFYFELPEKPKPPFALVFEDAAPIPLTPK